MQFSITLPFVFHSGYFCICRSYPYHFSATRRQDTIRRWISKPIKWRYRSHNAIFGAFPKLDGLALTTQAHAAETALQDATGVILTLAQELSDNAMVQVLKAELVDNNFLLGISLQFQDFAYGMKLDIPARIPFTMNIGQPSNPFSETLGLYCSDAIPEINTLFRIVGSFVNNGITIVALPPNNCPS